ncbi:MAG: hypothetical protein Q9160_004314 [Pyrenula sp. 1 TL-2023]
MSTTRTIQEYLRSPNPVLFYSQQYIASSTTTNTTNADPLDSPNAVKKWQNFPYGFLRPTEEEVLKKLLECPVEKSALPNYSNIEEFPFRHVFDEDSIESFVVRWNQSLVSAALLVGHENAPSIARELACEWPRYKIYMAKGGQSYLADSRTKTFPDWAGIRKWDRREDGLHRNVLPGETKRSDKWGHDSLLGYNAQGDNEQNPVVQIYNYCLTAGTSLGYIITDKELVAVRVDALETTLHWATVSWNHKSGEMSINEALWWLHMMALVDVDRPSTNAPEPSSQASVTSSWKGKSPTPPPPTKHQIAAAERGPRNTRSRAKAKKNEESG